MPRRPSPALVVAFVALAASITGTAVGAGYVISRSSQVKPGAIALGNLSTTAVKALRTPNGIFGDGSDGARTITGHAVLTRDTFYTNLTLAAGADLGTAGWRLFVSGTLRLGAGARVECDGTSATADLAGSGCGASGSIGRGVDGCVWDGIHYNPVDPGNVLGGHGGGMGALGTAPAVGAGALHVLATVLSGRLIDGSLYYGGMGGDCGGSGNSGGGGGVVIVSAQHVVGGSGSAISAGGGSGSSVNVGGGGGGVVIVVSADSRPTAPVERTAPGVGSPDGPHQPTSGLTEWLVV